MKLMIIKERMNATRAEEKLAVSSETSERLKLKHKMLFIFRKLAIIIDRTRAKHQVIRKTYIIFIRDIGDTLALKGYIAT
jgi:hypothetical protein